MEFVAISLSEKQWAPWDSITHVRLLQGRRPDTETALERWRQLKALADVNGIIELEGVIRAIDPVRADGDREKSIKSDLRYWSNPEDHGTTSKDKGWLELGYLSES